MNHLLVLQRVPSTTRQGSVSHLSYVRWVFLIKVFFVNYVPIVGCELFEGAHTASAVAEKIHKILKDFLIQNKIGYVVSDSASNMVAGIIF